jgi:pimeloyl-[acyl-carrier protein] methyl ester esterase
MDKVVFVHGWGFDPSFWDPVRERLDGVKSGALNLGFFGEENIIEGDVYITHSMGLAWTLLNAKPKALIAINGFTKFCSNEEWVDGVAPRMLHRMIRQFDRNPDKVWCDFMTNSGMKNPEFPDGANPQTLCKGLQNLENWDVREAFSAFSGKKLILSSNKDRIVPEKLTSASFGDDVIWYKEGNHLLPISDPQSVADNIREFLDQI